MLLVRLGGGFASDSIYVSWGVLVPLRSGDRAGFVAGKGEHTPGAKARFFRSPMRPKAEALGYLDATTKTTATTMAAG